MLPHTYVAWPVGSLFPETWLIMSSMSDVETTADHRDERGRFLAGNSGNGGRPKGARSKLGEAFLEDLRDAWNEHGAAALKRCAIEEPAQFCRIVASLMPKDVNLNLSVDAADFATKFRSARAMLGNDEPLPPRRSLRTIAPQTIERDDAD
jgi:hypothetical protein